MKMNMFVSAIFVVLVVSMLNMVNCAEIPEFIHTCKKDDPELNMCLKNSIEAIRPYLINGYPEYNIPSVDPIKIKELIKEESSGLKIETTDVIAHGGGDFIINNVSVDISANKIVVNILLPNLRIEAKYSLDGKLMMIPLKGNGDFYANLTDCMSHLTIFYEFFNIDGEQHMKFTAYKLKVKIGGGDIRLENLFGGDKTLSKVVNDAINKNLNSFMKELQPYIEKSLAANFMEIGNKIIEPYTVKQLFP